MKHTKDNPDLMIRVRTFFFELSPEIKKTLQLKNTKRFTSTFIPSEEYPHGSFYFDSKHYYLDEKNGSRPISSVMSKDYIKIIEDPNTFITNIEKISVMFESNGEPAYSSGNGFASSSTLGYSYRRTFGITYNGLLVVETENYDKKEQRVVAETTIFLNKEAGNRYYLEFKNNIKKGLANHKRLPKDKWEEKINQSVSTGELFRSTLTLTHDEIKHMERGTVFRNKNRKIEAFYHENKTIWKVSLLKEKYKGWNKIYFQPSEALLAYNNGNFGKR